MNKSCWHDADGCILYNKMFDVIISIYRRSELFSKSSNCSKQLSPYQLIQGPLLVVCVQYVL